MSVLRLNGRVLTCEAVRFARIAPSKNDWKSLRASAFRESSRGSLRESARDDVREVLAGDTRTLSGEIPPPVVESLL